jgi:A nuclease family of the HNH/ENDO VII superfamily with conserved AHH
VTVSVVYSLSFAADDFAGLYIPDRGERERMRSLEGRPMADAWQPPTVEWETGIGRPLADYTRVDILPAFTEDAYRRLALLLDGRGEVLPLTVTQGPPAVAFNVTRFVDEALDQERSVIDRYSTGRIAEVDEPYFRSELLEGETIFKLALMPKGRIYVTDTFVESAEREGITGMYLWHVWPLEREPAEEEAERVYTRIVPGEEDLGPPDEPVAHHIIPPLDIDSPDLERSQAHAQALGIDPDEAANGVFLPRLQHQSAYTDGYFAELWERFSRAGDRDEGVAVLASIADDLKAGRFPGR